MKSKIKSFFKRFAPLAMMVLMLCTMTVTAFAAEAVPDGYTLMENSGQWKYGTKTCFPGYKGSTYTIETIDTQAFVLSVHGINEDGTTVELYKHSGAVKSYTYTADGTYKYLTLVCAPGAQRDATVTWTEPEPPSLTDNVGEFVSTFLNDIGRPVVSFIVTNPICLIPVALGLVVLGYALIKRLIYGV